MPKVFIDGKAGTTGLRIYERLEARRDIELITLSEELRKDAAARKQALNSADVVFLCLPDAAAIEAAAMVENSNTVIIDTSTAHRTNDDWCYGFPEICGQKQKIAASKRIANPGCHATGFISLIAPLTQCGIVKATAKLSCFSLTGYSGGGKKMIADYENEQLKSSLLAPRTYGLSQSHKHLPEIVKICGLENAPAFSPIVSSYYSGMEVAITLFADDINGDIEKIKQTYKEYYTGPLVKYVEAADENGFMSAAAFSGRDDMEISVFGNNERITLISRFDNLGKGASGAAIQNMNILLSVDETAGLNIGG
ncbi:MAG: N-acetyl-gamma-glutamyl-phosphate reductase [Clostridia bacterium]|nr:N-acetyl-gamma-glutamyl-phosphate reductase [Clostridia bacterium]